jgi:predicted TIM-barrel fold metal-dependent hydrolase
MDQAGIEASLCFPNMFTRFCGQTFLEAGDQTLAQLCVEAYNDWMTEEWSAGSGGRLIPLAMIPLWDAQLAAKEVLRNAARGVHAVCFSELPAHLGLPSIHDPNRYWDPFFQACSETNTVVCIHVGSSSQVPITSADAPAVLSAMLIQNNSYASLCDWLFSGIFMRFPNLKIAYSEGEIGWIPFLLERADWVWDRHRGWADRSIMNEPPSAYYYRHVFGCFISDQHGVDSIDKVGVDNAMFESDYPHADTNWPSTRLMAASQLAGLSPEIREKVIRGNAIRLFSLPFA